MALTFTDEQIAQFPPWLQALIKATPEQRTSVGYTDEMLEQASKAYHLDKDYTQAKQRLAGVEKILSERPGMSIEKAAELYDWYAQNQDTISRLWANRERLTQPAEPARNGDTPAQRRKWRDAEAADLYETDRLRAVFEDLETSAYERAVNHVKNDWYTKEIAPLWDKQAGGYLATVVDLIDFARDPKYQGLATQDILKERAARGPNKSFREVGDLVLAERESVRSAALEEGRRLGLEEGKKAAPSADGPSGPMGAGQPAWKSPVNTTPPKTPQDRFARVMESVEAKHGKLPV